MFLLHEGYLFAPNLLAFPFFIFVLELLLPSAGQFFYDWYVQRRRLGVTLSQGNFENLVPIESSHSW